MTALEMRALIKNTLQSVVPPAISSAGLSPIEQFVTGRPKQSDDIELAVYLDFENDSTTAYNVGFIIQLQLFGKDNGTEYHSILFDLIRENITASLLGADDRESVNSDIWPADNVGSSFVFYNLEFSKELDDCDV